MLMLNCFGSPHVLTPVSRQCLESRNIFTMSQSHLVSTKSEMSWLISCLGTSVLANVSISEKMSWLHRWPKCSYYHLSVNEHHEILVHLFKKKYLWCVYDSVVMYTRYLMPSCCSCHVCKIKECKYKNLSPKIWLRNL